MYLKVYFNKKANRLKIQIKTTVKYGCCHHFGVYVPTGVCLNSGSTAVLEGVELWDAGPN